MEMKIDEKLSVMELLKRAAKLLFSNISFRFLPLSPLSLPLFCFLIFFELSLQTTISLAYQFPSHKLNLGGYFLLQDQINFPENDLIPWLIQTSLLYFFPYSLLDLFTTTMIVAASSTHEEKLLGMLYLVRRSAKIYSVNFLFIASLTRQSFYKLFYAVVILIHEEEEEEDGKGIWNQRSCLFHIGMEVDMRNVTFG
ncbi:hypothetical protein Bca52824_063754 [Brassica carinata]|uniref:Uncharacterized protein n=1 Tax=Brassica carinata TaxID=52824 RepID=A0A8X7QKF8_BRACI|nr:hypothetical protein Bca52824_063754 [Brassica carinata]